MSQDTGRASRKTFLWIVLASASPFVLATLMYMVWTPGSINTVGEFLAPKASLDAPDLLDGAGRPAALKQLRGKWLLLMAYSGPCDVLCVSTLYRMRQVRIAQGEYMDRVERVWLTNAPPDNETSGAEADGVLLRRDPTGQLYSQLPSVKAGHAGAVYLIDPNGNLVMRYESTIDPVRMIRELTRIIKINNGLG